MHDVRSTLSDFQPVWCITHIPKLIARFLLQAFLQVAARSPRRRQNNKILAARLAAMAKSPNFPRVYPNLLTATVYSSIGHERISRGRGGRVVAVPGAQCRVFVAHETIGGDEDENNRIRVELRYAANRLVAWWYREGTKRSGGDVQGG